MEEKEFHIYDHKNNKQFVVTKFDGSFTCKKVVGSTLVEPTKEELEFVIEQLEKKAYETHSFDEYINDIINLIHNKNINNYEELHNYINGLNISEDEKYKLFEETHTHLKIENKEKTEIVKLRDELIDIIRKNEDKNIDKIISFDVKSNISGEALCNIKLKTVNNGISKIQKDITHYYTDELKKDLIEPVLQEMVLASRAIQSVEPSDASFGYRSNFHLQTEDNCYAHLNNIEQDYAYKLQENILSLNNSSKISDSTARDSKINELQNEKEMEIKLEQEQQLKLVKMKKMDDKKGFSSNLIIYLLITVVTTFIILTQIMLFK